MVTSKPYRLVGTAAIMGLACASLIALGGRSHTLGRPAAVDAAAAQTSPTPGTAGPIPVNGQANAGATTTIQNPGVVSWVHFGDLHIQTGDMQNYQDFQTIIQNTNQYLLNGVNFAVLPGDNANEGSASEYQLIKQATDQLQVPLYAVPGDHDLKGGNLSLFEQYLEPVPYQSFNAGTYHFVFLDALDASAGGGFGIGSDQMAWLTNDLNAAAGQGLQSVLFMHTYPGGLGNSAQAVQDLVNQDKVLMVDVGHTHYNDVSNDGHTVYAATRSTGQDTEGPVGFSVSNLDNGVVSWKFKPLGSWPFVMITSPADEQLITDPSQPNQVVRGTVDLRAKIWDDKGVASATYQVDGDAAQSLAQIGATQMWSAPLDSTQLADGDHKVQVNVQGAGGNTSEDTVTIRVDQSGTYQPPTRQPGQSGNSIGTYAEKGLLGNHTAGGPGGGAKGGPGGGPKGGGAAGTPAAAPSTQSNGSLSPATTAPGTSTAPLGGSSSSATAPSAANAAGAGNNAQPAPAGPGGKGHGPKGAGGPNGSGPGAGGTATITAVNGNTLTIQTASGQTQQVTISGSTSIVKEVAGSQSDLQQGQKVAVQTSQASDGSLTVSAIEIPKQ